MNNRTSNDLQEKFEDTKEVIGNHKSEKGRQYNGQQKKDKAENTMTSRKRTSNDLQNSSHKTKDREPRIPLKVGDNLQKVSSPYFICDVRLQNTTVDRKLKIE